MRKLTALIALGLILGSSVWGQVPNLPKAPSKPGPENLPAEKIPAGAHELTAQDLETFLDGVVPLQLEVFSDRGDVWFHLIQMIGVIGAIGTLVVLFNAIQSWRNRGKRIWGKLQATLFVLACLGFLWFTFAGNLLHFNSNY